MEDERAYELFMSQMGLLKEANAHLRKQVDGLLREQTASRKLQEEHDRQSMETIKELTNKVSELNLSMQMLQSIVDHQNQIIQAKEEYVQALLQKIANLENEVKDGRKHRFARTSEQQRLLNNRESDTRAEEKANFNGKDTGSDRTSATTPNDAAPKSSSSKNDKKKRQPKQYHKCDETRMHYVKDYYSLPNGATFVKRKGKLDVCYYRTVEVIKAKYIEHIYEVARVRLKDGSFVNTMNRPFAELEGILSPAVLAQVICWKYVYHLPVNRIKRLLRDSGLHFSKATLNRYMQNGLRLLREYLEDSMRSEVISTDYIMTDETTELVGVKDENGGKSYKKKYLWAFYAQLKKIVYYLYESGSRARKVVVDFLTDFSGFISTDGYVAYSIFDDAERHPGIVHVGCWVHARRKFIDALPSDRRAMEIINMIAELFKLELAFKVQKLTPDQIKVRRERRSKTILRRIHDRVVLMSTDLKLMTNEMMSNAVNYMLNQWKSLENFIKDGRVQISNNLCEQRMKPVKLNLKNCQNIGSENAAENTAFVFSLTESCRLNGINPETYLERLFKCIVSKETYDKRQLLPCYIKI